MLADYVYQQTETKRHAPKCYTLAVSLQLRVGGDSEGWWGSACINSSFQNFPCQARGRRSSGKREAQRVKQQLGRDRAHAIELARTAHRTRRLLIPSISRIATGASFQHAS